MRRYPVYRRRGELLEGDTLRRTPRDVAAAALDRAGLCRAGRPRPRGGTRTRHRSSRSEAGEHLRHARRAGEAPRFRTGHRTRGRRGDEATRPAQTEEGLVLGTAGYMSPEQARGEHADTRSDIFRSGACCTRCSPRDAPSRAPAGIETLHAVLKEHPPNLTHLRGDVSQSLNRVVRRCLEKAPDSRFQTARDLVFALENLAPGSESTPAPSQAVPARRARGAAVVIVAAVALLAVGATLWWTVLRESAPRAGRVASPGSPGPPAAAGRAAVREHLG